MMKKKQSSLLDTGVVAPGHIISLAVLASQTQHKLILSGSLHLEHEGMKRIVLGISAWYPRCRCPGTVVGPDKNICIIVKIPVSK